MKILLDSFADGNNVKEKQQPDKKQKLSFGMMKKTFPTKTGIKITLNSPATVSLLCNTYNIICRYELFNLIQFLERATYLTQTSIQVRCSSIW